MTGTASVDEVDVPLRPDLPGLRFRRFRGSEDFPGMLEANRAARDAYGISDPVSVEGIATQYANLTNSDIEHDLVVVEVHDWIVGYFRVAWEDQRDGSRTYGSVVLLRPELRGHGIGTAMLDWVERRNRAIAAGHPVDGRPRYLQAEQWDADEYANRLLRRHGYEPVRRWFEMRRPTLDDIPDAPLPEGLEIRPVTRDDMRRLWEADVEAFRDHWGGVDESEAAWLRFRDEPSYDPALFVIAFDGDEVAGMVFNVIDREDEARTGECRLLLDSVGVRRPWRRRGLARALIARSLRLGLEHGATSAMLSVDSENPNRAMTLYEEAGFRVATSGTTWRKPLHEET